MGLLCLDPSECVARAALNPKRCSEGELASAEYARDKASRQFTACRQARLQGLVGEFNPSEEVDHGSGLAASSHLLVAPGSRGALQAFPRAVIRRPRPRPCALAGVPGPVPLSPLCDFRREGQRDVTHLPRPRCAHSGGHKCPKVLPIPPSKGRIPLHPGPIASVRATEVRLRPEEVLQVVMSEGFCAGDGQHRGARHPATVWHASHRLAGDRCERGGAVGVRA